MPQEEQLELPGFPKPDAIPPATPDRHTDIDGLNRFVTMQEAAGIIGIGYWKIQRGVKAGIIPSYSFFDTKKYVRIADILHAMKAGFPNSNAASDRDEILGRRS